MVLSGHVPQPTRHVCVVVTLAEGHGVVGRQDTSAWPQKIWEMYTYDRSAKEKKTQMEWSLVMTRILPLDVSDGEPDSPKTRPSSSSAGGRSEDLG